MVLARQSPRLAARSASLRHPADVNGVAFVRGGRSIVTTADDGSLLLWDAATQSPQRATFERPRAGVVFTRPAVSRDGRTLAAGAQDGTIALWDVASRRLLGTLPTRSSRPVTSVAFSPDGRTLASAGEEPRIRLWDVPSSQRGRSAAASRRPADLPDRVQPRRPHARLGRKLVTSCACGTCARARRRAAGCEDGRRQLTSLAYAADGRLAVGGADVLLWNPAPRNDAKRIVDRGDRDPRSRSAPTARGSSSASTTGQDRAVAARRAASAARSAPRPARATSTSVELSPDGRTIAAAARRQGVAVRRHAPAARRRARRRPTATSPSTAAGGRSPRSATDRIWLADARTARRARAPLTDRERVERIALSPDGRTLASIGEGRDILLWDLRARKVTARLTGDGETHVEHRLQPRRAAARRRRRRGRAGDRPVGRGQAQPRRHAPCAGTAGTSTASPSARTATGSRRPAPTGRSGCWDVASRRAHRRPRRAPRRDRRRRRLRSRRATRWRPPARTARSGFGAWTAARRAG